MNLGIAGRKAIVCASSRGLGKACARALAEAGCEVVINGRDAKKLEATAAELSSLVSVKVIPVAADVATAEGQKALLAACPEPDILVNNNGGPPMRNFRELTRAQMIDGVIANMVVAVELIQKVIDPMCQRKFGRIVNITSSSVKMPLAGLDLSSGARAGLTAFLAGVARTVADKNVTINNILPGAFDTDRLRGTLSKTAEQKSKSVDQVAADGPARGDPQQRAEAVPGPGEIGEPARQTQLLQEPDHEEQRARRERVADHRERRAVETEDADREDPEQDEPHVAHAAVRQQPTPWPACSRCSAAAARDQPPRAASES